MWLSILHLILMFPEHVLLLFLTTITTILPSPGKWRVWPNLSLLPGGHSLRKFFSHQAPRLLWVIHTHWKQQTAAETKQVMVFVYFVFWPKPISDVSILLSIILKLYLFWTLSCALFCFSPSILIPLCSLFLSPALKRMVQMPTSLPSSYSAPFPTPSPWATGRNMRLTRTVPYKRTSSTRYLCEHMWTSLNNTFTHPRLFLQTSLLTCPTVRKVTWSTWKSLCLKLHK